MRRQRRSVLLRQTTAAVFHSSGVVREIVAEQKGLRPPAKQIFHLMAEQVRDALIGEGDAEIPVHHPNAFIGRLHDSAVFLLALTQGILGSLPLGLMSLQRLGHAVKSIRQPIQFADSR